MGLEREVDQRQAWAEYRLGGGTDAEMFMEHIPCGTELEQTWREPQTLDVFVAWALQHQFECPEQSRA